MKYENTPHKIRYLWFKTQENANDIDRLNTLNFKTLSISHFEHASKIDTGWTVDDSLSYTLSLERFPERLVPFVKIIPIVKTTNGHESGNDYLDDFEFIAYFRQLGQTSSGYYNYEYKMSIWVEPTASQPTYLKFVILLPNERFYNEIQANKT